MLRTLPDTTETTYVVWSTYLTDETAAALFGACHYAAARQTGPDDADDVAMTAALTLASRFVGDHGQTPDDIRAAAWTTVRNVARRLSDPTDLAGDLADLADLADTVGTLAGPATPDPAAPYATTPGDLANVALRMAARSLGDPDLVAAVAAAVAETDKGSTGPAAVIRTAVRTLTGSDAERPETTRAGRVYAGQVRRLLAALPTRVAPAAARRMASGAEDTPPLRRNVTTGRWADYAASLGAPVRSGWDDDTATLARTSQDDTHAALAAPTAPVYGSGPLVTFRPSHAALPAPYAAPVTVTAGGHLIGAWGAADHGAVVLAYARPDLATATRTPSASDREADGFAARGEAPGPVRKPGRKGSRIGSTGPTVPVRLSR